VVDEETSDPQVIPYLLYADAGAALDWLAAAFGFTVRRRDARKDGIVRHAELQLDRGGVIMLGSPGPGYRGPASLGGPLSWYASRIPAWNLTGTGPKP